MATEKKKLITTPTLVLMIISTIYGFGNVSIAYAQMSYAGMFWYIIGGICFFFPCCLMMAEYGSAFNEAKGGIYSWLAGSIGEKLAFIGTFIFGLHYQRYSLGATLLKVGTLVLWVRRN